ncbi:MAG: long-chain-fatty-acid--CoA ligase [Dehalococcoidia bacterium]|nr:long-chain-fatty-acid--CoA ligase [Dehalococcoidia bacterium]
MLTTEFLTIASAICPDKEAVVFESRHLTFADLNDRTNRLANALRGLGVGKGDRLAVLQVNCNEVVETYFAAAKLGAVWSPLNFRARADELSYMINNAEARALLVGKRYWDTAHSMRPHLKTVRHIISLEGKAEGMEEYDALLSAASADEVMPDSADDDTTILMFTAGTTGSPKGVSFTHQSFSGYVLNNVTPADPDTVEKNILTVPLYHIAGVQAMMSSVYGGRTLVVQRQFEPKEWMELVQRNKVDRAMMVPTMLKQLLDNPDFGKYDLSSLKVITYGAAPMPLEVIKKAIFALPDTQFINAFGQTESAGTICALGPEDHKIPKGLPPAEVDKRLKRLGSIGKPLSDVEVRIVDEMGRDVPEGVVGEIVARGDRIMKGYWKQEDATRKTIRGGWLYTGDLGYRDDAGYIFLAGRAKDIIKRGGEMISPEEVEQTLMAHPAVDDAAIIGIPDVEWGERVRAIVVLKNAQKATPEELTEFCRQRLSSFKKPESVVFAKELPRNPMGKVLKRILREKLGQADVQAAQAAANAGAGLSAA